MEFRGPTAIREEYDRTKRYLTMSLDDPQAGAVALVGLIEELGNCIYRLPHWHPVLRRANPKREKHISSIQQLDAYSGADHTAYFVRGFITCPYSRDAAERLVASANDIEGIHARMFDQPLYSDNAFPVIVQSYEVDLEADGTIDTRSSIAWFVEWVTEDASKAEVAETWWNIRRYILGVPHGSRSSICVNQFAGRQMRRILETLNDSGLFGPILESSLEMLSESKRRRIAETLMQAAFKAWDETSERFHFLLRGEDCCASIRDTFDDKSEFNIDVWVGNHELAVQGFYYPESDQWEFLEPTGKRQVAEKFT